MLASGQIKPEMLRSQSTNMCNTHMRFLSAKVTYRGTAGSAMREADTLRYKGLLATDAISPREGGPLEKD